MNHIPPQNLEAERAVLGGILLENDSINELPTELTPTSFYSPDHGKIFAAMCDLFEQIAPIDVVSLGDHLKKAGHDISISKLAAIMDDGMPKSITYHANAIVEAYQQRRTLNAVREALEQLYESPEQHDEILSRLIQSDEQPSNIEDTTEVMTATFKRLDRAKGLLIPTGFKELDKKIGGIERGELLVVGGRPSMGKSSFVIDVGMGAAQCGFKVLVVSVEGTSEKLGTRLLSRETKINSRKLRMGELDDGERRRLVDASGKLSNLPIRVISRERDWPVIKRKVHQCKRAFGLDVVILDYLTLLDIPASKTERRDVAVGRIANEAKQLAVLLDLGFILVSQLNRSGGDEPTMSDLRESGEIEQAADVIIFPFRPAVYDPEFRPRDKGFLKIAKARDLPIGDIEVRFNAEITSFSDWIEFKGEYDDDEGRMRRHGERGRE